MASSGSKSVTVTSYDTLKFTWSEVSQDIANNKTKISWKLQLVSGAYGAISSSVAKDWSVTVNGTNYSGTNSVAIGNNTTKTLAEGTTTIVHNADGAKTFSFSFSQEFAITFSGASIGTKSGSGTGVLDTIPRATTPKLSTTSEYMGESITITLDRASSSFTHDLAYSFAGASYVSIATGVGSSKAWEIPDLASKIPKATSGTLTIRCITKNGSTSIGTKTVTMTIKVPTDVIPTISSVAVTETVSGLAAQFGAFVQNKSKVKVTITAAGAKGSTISSYSTTLQGKTYTGSSWTSGVLTSSGSLSLTTTVKDSRGRSAKKTTTISVTAYSKPSISRFKAARGDSLGAAADDGIYALLTYSYEVASVGGKNTASMNVQWKKTTDSSYNSTPCLTGSALSAATTSKVNSPTFSLDSQYDLLMTVTDWFGEQATYSAVLRSEAVIMDLMADGTAVSFGKVSGLSKFMETAWSLWTLEKLFTGNKTGYQDGKQGIQIDNEGFIHLQRNSPDGYHPYIGFYLGEHTASDGQIRVNASTGAMELIGADDVILGSTIAGVSNFRPYFRKGDKISVVARTAGYVTNGKTEVTFMVSMSKPVIGSPTVTITSDSGFVLRQGDKYTHGSAASVFVKPTSYKGGYSDAGGIWVTATFSDTTNATNNDAIGIYWDGSIEFT